jgi:hypothetical protein
MTDGVPFLKKDVKLATPTTTTTKTTTPGQ